MAGFSPFRVWPGTWLPLLLAAANGPAAAVGAQQVRPFTAPAAFTIDQWTMEDGLPQNSVNALVQGPDGYLWIGTYGGLARFDGAEFTVMERMDSAGRHLDRVLSLAVGPDGALWIGTEDGLVRRKDGEYRRYDVESGLPSNEISALRVDEAGVVWIGTAGGGLARLEDGRIESFPPIESLGSGRVVGIVEDAAGTLWVNAGRSGYITIEDGTLSADRWHAPPIPGVRHMQLQDRAGGYWFTLHGGGLARVENGAVRRYPDSRGAIMVEDPVGGVWLGTWLRGLLFLPEGAATARPYPLPGGERRYRVRALHVDREGNVWIGTDGHGLLRARRNLFTTYTTRNGLSHDVITAIYEDADGILWAATNCGGLNAIDRRAGTVRVFGGRQGAGCVFSLAGSSDGPLWAGSWGGGLRSYRDGVMRPRPEIRLPDQVVLALLTGRDGTLWVGTRTGGVSAVVDGRVQATYTTESGLVHDDVRTLAQTRDGALWIGTTGGLSRLAVGRFRNYTAADGLSSEHVRAIHEDSDGTLWIGTYGGGLIRLRDGVFSPIRRADGLASDVVSAILEDAKGRLWMTGNRGIFRASRRELNAFADGDIARVQSVLYGVEDGLLKAETNGGFHPAAWKDAAGRLWFPTIEGLAMVDPAAVVPSERHPPVTIEGVVVDGVRRSPGAEIHIGPGEANVRFHYTGLSLTSPEHLRFRYQLEGYEAEPVVAGSRRTAYYPRLPPGEYRFVVTAASREGVWNPRPAAIKLRISPPFWGAAWFRVLMLVVALGLLGLLFWWREMVGRRERAVHEGFSHRLIESREHERKRIARALHDELGQQLLVIGNRAQLALRSETMDAPARAQLEQIRSVADGSLETVRGLARTLTPHELQHLGLSTALRTMIRAVSETAEITIGAEIDEVDGRLSDEAQLNLYRVVQEGLNNVARHSDARHAAVTVRRVGEAIEVTITDSGRGFVVRRDVRGHLAGGFGLSGMAARVRILNGRVDVRSAPGRGTRISVSIPVMAEERP